MNNQIAARSFGSASAHITTANGDEYRLRLDEDDVTPSRHCVDCRACVDTPVTSNVQTENE